jgi:Putative DNA-binding domain
MTGSPVATSPTFLDALLESLRDARSYNQNAEIAPAAVLWPDPEGVWGGIIPRLRDLLPVLTLGEYEPKESIGPATWIRCVVSRALEGVETEHIPFVYLPGWGIRRLRAVAEYERTDALLAELQFRGSLWLQPDGREWSISAFLQRGDCGLGVAVQKGEGAQAAMREALIDLADQPVSVLRENAPLKTIDFRSMRQGMGPVGGPDLEDLIAGGESDYLEFKATGRVPLGEKAANKELEGEVLRAIGGFLNAQGGTLLIGVEDDGTIHGLHEDYGVSKTKRPDEDIRDAYIRYFMDKLDTSYGKRFLSCVSFRMVSTTSRYPG